MLRKVENKQKDTFLAAAAEHIAREGSSDLLDYLCSQDFFTAPASTMFHDSCDRGLVTHSLAVFDSALILDKAFNLQLNMESVAICALFHDVCKMNMYEKGVRNKKISGEWVQVDVWEVNDTFPLGHGEKSIFIINKFMSLTDEEALAIRWHLGGFDPAIHFAYPYGFSSKKAFGKNKLVSLIAMADFSATYLLGGE